MAWATPDIPIVGDPIATAWGIIVRDNMTALQSHTHGGAAGDGANDLAQTESVTFTDIVAPGAPGAGDTRWYMRDGIPRYHPNGGSETPMADTTHEAEHEPGGSDTMAVDAAVGVGSLRTLGAGAQQIAVGDHAPSYS